MSVDFIKALRLFTVVIPSYHEWRLFYLKWLNLSHSISSTSNSISNAFPTLRSKEEREIKTTLNGHILSSFPMNYDTKHDMSPVFASQNKFASVFARLLISCGI